MKSELEILMLKPAILALVRQIFTVAGTALVAKDYVQASDIEPVIGALLTIGSVVRSVADKRWRSRDRAASLRPAKRKWKPDVNHHSQGG